MWDRIRDLAREVRDHAVAHLEQRGFIQSLFGLSEPQAYAALRQRILELDEPGLAAFWSTLSSMVQEAERQLQHAGAAGPWGPSFEDRVARFAAYADAGFPASRAEQEAQAYLHGLHAIAAAAAQYASERAGAQPASPPLPTPRSEPPPTEPPWSEAAPADAPQDRSPARARPSEPTLDDLLALNQLQDQAQRLLVEGMSHYQAGDLAPAERGMTAFLAAGREHLEGTLAWNEASPTPFDVVAVVEPLLNVGLILADLLDARGAASEARRRRDEVQALASAHLGDVGRARIERQHASTLLSEARFTEALTVLAAARDVFAANGEELDAALTALDLANVLEWLCDYERALTTVKQARARVQVQLDGLTTRWSDITRLVTAQLTSMEPDPESLSRMRTAQEAAKLLQVGTDLDQLTGRLHRWLREWDEAVASFQRVRRAFADMGGDLARAAAAGIDFQQAAVMVERGDGRGGLQALAQLEPLFERGLLRPRRPALRSLKARALLDVGDTCAALEAAEAGLRDVALQPDPDTAWKLHRWRGNALRTLGRAADGLDALVAGARAVDELRRAPLGYRLDSTSMRDRMPLFDEAIALAVELDRPRDACLLIELAKARALSAVLSVPPERRTAAASERERRFDELTRQLDALEFARLNHDWDRARQERQRELRASREQLLEELRFADPRWRTLSSPAPVDLDGVLDRLRQRQQAALVLHLRDGVVTSVLLHDGELKAAEQVVPDAALAALREYSANLARKQPDRLLNDLSQARGVTVDAFVPRELLSEALEASSLVVVPHRDLHLLPWAALEFQDRRLFTHCPVGLVPNLSLLTTAASARVPGVVGLIGAADHSGLQSLEDLKEAPGELQDLAELHAGRLVTPPIMGPDATEAAFWNLASRRDGTGLLHVTCHGTIDEREPMSSGLLFTDGKVDAGEIALRGIEWNEVVLAACSSGWRPSAVRADGKDRLPLSGDDVLGLPGAFLEARASTVLVSIPEAQDAAARTFVTAYHRHRAAGAPPLAAYQRTQLELDESDPQRAFHWVGFVLYGCT